MQKDLIKHMEDVLSRMVGTPDFQEGMIAMYKEVSSYLEIKEINKK